MEVPFQQVGRGSSAQVTTPASAMPTRHPLDVRIDDAEQHRRHHPRQQCRERLERRQAEQQSPVHGSVGGVPSCNDTIGTTSTRVFKWMPQEQLPPAQAASHHVPGRDWRVNWLCNSHRAGQHRSDTQAVRQELEPQDALTVDVPRTLPGTPAAVVGRRHPPRLTVSCRCAERRMDPHPSEPAQTVSPQHHWSAGRLLRVPEPRDSSRCTQWQRSLWWR